MLAYAIRFKVKEIILFYPNTVTQHQQKVAELVIKDDLAGGEEIYIKAFQLPILNKELLTQPLDSTMRLDSLFDSTRLALISQINEIL